MSIFFEDRDWKDKERIRSIIPRATKSPAFGLIQKQDKFI
jgi:hypothetical protein